jgi:PTS system ascorbate-specific IIC component
VLLDATGLEGATLILLGGLIVGIGNTFYPSICQPFMKDIMKGDSIAMGHTGNFGYAISGLIGRAIGGGKEVKSTEDINFPKGLAFLRDTTLGISFTMGITYFVVALCSYIKDPAYITGELSDGQNFFMYALMQAGTFTAGMLVILMGVRMILAEIIPAFKGISDKLVPNAKPALDCPIVFSQAPNAVLIGFISSFVGGVVSLFIQLATGLTVVVPGVVPHFFCGGTAGVFGNARGGVKGAVVGSFIQGIIISFFPIFLMPGLSAIGFSGATFGDTDYAVTGLLLSGASNAGGLVAVIITVCVALVALIAVPMLFKGKKAN